MNRRVIRKRSSAYYRRERNNWLMIILVWAAIIGTCYYIHLGAKCYRHFEELRNGVVTTINIGR